MALLPINLLFVIVILFKKELDTSIVIPAPASTALLSDIIKFFNLGDELER